MSGASECGSETDVEPKFGKCNYPFPIFSRKNRQNIGYKGVGTKSTEPNITAFGISAEIFWKIHFIQQGYLFPSLSISVTQ